MNLRTLLFTRVIMLLAFAFAPRLPAAQPPAEEIVELPAFVVGDKAATPIPWLYAVVPGIEILSCLSASDTSRVVNALREQSRLLAWELPPELRSLPGPPAQLVLDDRTLTALRLPLNQTALKQVAAGDRRRIVGMVLRHWDFTSSYINDSGSGGSMLSSGQSILARFAGSQMGAESFGLLDRSPRPPWLMRLWGSIVGFDRHSRGDSVMFTQTPPPAQKKSSTDKKLPLPSLAGVFNHPSRTPPENNAAATAVDEAGQWFVRWAIYADGGAHRSAFWNFVNANTLQPEVNDALLQRHFSLSLAELDQRVGKFRSEIEATRDGRIEVPLGTIPPSPALRAATETEIARVLGRWSLLALRNNPALVPSLSSAARRVLDRGLKLRTGDAQLTALLGLVELEAGNLEPARAALESVAESPELDARSRFELARLRYEAFTQSTARGGKLDSKQVAAILAPLAPFRHQPPSNAEPLALVAQTWIHAAEKPAREELVAFAGLARQFPRRPELLLPTAQLCFDQNLDHEANALVTIGLQITDHEPAVHSVLRELKDRIDARSSSKK